MKNFLKSMAIVGGMLILAGCSAGQDRFAPGTWKLESWMGAEGESRTTPRTAHAVKLSQQVAARDARSVMFTEFYHGVQGGAVIFEGGVISGSLDQQAVAPFPAHKQDITGTYAADRFEIRIAMPMIMGVQTYQFVTGRLVDPL